MDKTDFTDFIVKDLAVYKSTLLSDEELAERLEHYGWAVSIDTSEFWEDLESFYMGATMIPIGQVAGYGGEGTGKMPSFTCLYCGGEPDDMSSSGTYDYPEDFDDIALTIATNAYKVALDKKYTKIQNMEAGTYITLGEYTDDPKVRKAWIKAIREVHIAKGWGV